MTTPQDSHRDDDAFVGRTARAALDADDAREWHTARAAAYGALSRLLTSPSEQPWALAVVRAESARLMEAHAYLPFDVDATALESSVAALDSAALERAAIDYGAQFEVGEHGPPLAIRAELAPGANAASKEEVARFYEYFGYEVGDRAAWQLDHLAVLLEFLHYLSFGAASHAESAGGDAYARGARDFVARHVVAWLPAVATHVASGSASRYLRALFQTTATFVTADRAWLATHFPDDKIAEGQN
jgi:DMSO reductase family type II enzyme chaperone